MTEEEIRAFQQNLDYLIGSLECLRLTSVLYQQQGAHEEVYPTAEKILSRAIESSTNMREIIRLQRKQRPYKLP